MALAALGLAGCDGDPTSAPGALPRDGAATGATDADLDDAAVASGGHDGGEPSGDHVRLGTVVQRAGGSFAIGVDVPADALAFAVTATVESGPWAAALVRLVAPDGAILFDASDARSTGPYRPGMRASLLRRTPYTFLYPNAPHLPFEPGTYHVELTAGALAEEGERIAPVVQDLEVSVDVTFRLGSAPPDQGVIDLAIWSATPDLDAEAARDDRSLTDALGVARDIFDRVHLRIGAVEYHDLVDAGTGDVTDLDDLARVFGRLHAGAALPVVLLRSIELGAGRTVLGRTSGIPGPPPRENLPRSGGVAVSLGALAEGPERFGAMLAHEIAHYLGLGHTTGQDGATHDPIEDTPECPAERATRTGPTGAPVLSAEDCRDYDGGNLMFYTPPRADLEQTALTEGQAWMLLRSPAAR